MSPANNEIMACRICGLIQEEAPWGEDGNCPNFDFCSCCGVEFGYQDCIKDAVIDYRNKWLQAGAKWNNPKEKPKAWNMEKQLKNIPNKFK